MTTDRPRADVVADRLANRADVWQAHVQADQDTVRLYELADAKLDYLAATLLSQEHARAEKAEASVTRWQIAERDLSDAYVRLRVILDALDPPRGSMPSEIWTYTEDKAKALRARAEQLERLLSEADAVIVAAELAEMCSCWEHDAAVKAAYERHASRASPKPTPSVPAALHPSTGWRSGEATSPKQKE